MPKTVLIADESITIRSVAESLLRGESYSVRSAADGSMAMELAHAERPDLILLGEKLPGISGAEMCSQLKADPALSDVPIVFMRTDRPGEGPGSADAVLTKPFSPQTLLDTVERFLSGPKSLGDTGSHHVAIADTGLTEELIDQALGLDEVGDTTAEERQRPAQIEASGDEQPSASEFEAVENEPETSERETLGDFDVQVGMEEHGAGSRPPASSMDDDVDRALEAAFGSTIEKPPTPRAPEPPKPQETPQRSSLEEISLGESQHIPVPEVSSAGSQPAQGTDAGTTPPDENPEEPHDYSWFIAEMEKENATGTGPSQPADDGPRIEPVQPEPPSDSQDTSVTSVTQKVPTTGDKPPKSSEFEINVEEFEASKRGYDEFISEFRKEIAKLEGAVPGTAGASEGGTETAQGSMAFKDSRGNVSMPADIKALGDRLIDAVAQHVARELAAKIDPKTVYAMIETKLSRVGSPEE